ncbi:MAG: hypothetical protein CMN57_07900 [Gammaproteobacteria bacterium]|nr:hypothetical protein [Gammaproteobacteria bacterium]
MIAGGKTLYSIIESPAHPDFAALYRRLGLEQIKLNSQRKAINALKQNPPDWVVAEFFYGYGNNYAGVNVCNLDVFLYSLQKYAPGAKVIVLVEKPEEQYVSRLAELFALHAVLTLPVEERDMQAVLDTSP